MCDSGRAPWAHELDAERKEYETRRGPNPKNTLSNKQRKKAGGAAIIVARGLISKLDQIDGVKYTV